MTKLRFDTAAEVYAAFETVAEDVVAKPTDAPPLAFLSDLAASVTPEDSISFGAYMLGRREAVWWGCQCVRMLNGGKESSEALAAAETWVREPEETQRANALAAGLSADQRLPDAWLALAAGWSGGSMVLQPDAQRVPPPAHLTGRCVRGAVLLALARVDVRHRAAAIARCVEACRRAAGADGAGE